jgi:hypothetical protein
MDSARMGLGSNPEERVACESGWVRGLCAHITRNPQANSPTGYQARLTAPARGELS